MAMSPPRPTRPPRHRVRSGEARGVRGRSVLARTSSQVLAGSKRPVLGCEDRAQPRTRRTRQRRTRSDRLESPPTVGLRDRGGPRGRGAVGRRPSVLAAVAEPDRRATQPRRAVGHRVTGDQLRMPLASRPTSAWTSTAVRSVSCASSATSPRGSTARTALSRGPPISKAATRASDRSTSARGQCSRVHRLAEVDRGRGLQVDAGQRAETVRVGGLPTCPARRDHQRTDERHHPGMGSVTGAGTSGGRRGRSAGR